MDAAQPRGPTPRDLKVWAWRSSRLSIHRGDKELDAIHLKDPALRQWLHTLHTEVSETLKHDP